MRRECDAIVVGGGPAGTAAATTLARAGARVALLDKASFPRHKLCGGLLSERSTRALSRIFGVECDLPFEATAHGVKLFCNEALVNEIHDYKPLRFTARWDFDHFLLEQARSSGAHVLEDRCVTGLCRDHPGVVLGDGSRIAAKFVIGADGASSRIRKELGTVRIDRRGFAVALETEVARTSIARDIVDPEIYLGIVPWGYGWIFPKRTTVTVGVGALPSANLEIRKALIRFARMALDHVPEGPISGHPVPFGNYLRSPGTGRVLLVGDAAGLVEPITGEGIAFAMLSGHYAAQAVIEALRAGNEHAALMFYQRRYEEIVRLFDDARHLRYLVFSRMLQPFFVRLVGSTEALIMKHIDVLAGDATYRHYSRFFARAALVQLPHLLYPRQYRKGRASTYRTR